MVHFKKNEKGEHEMHVTVPGDENDRTEMVKAILNAIAHQSEEIPIPVYDAYRLTRLAGHLLDE